MAAAFGRLALQLLPSLFGGAQVYSEEYQRRIRQEQRKQNSNLKVSEAMDKRRQERALEQQKANSVSATGWNEYFAKKKELDPEAYEAVQNYLKKGTQQKANSTSASGRHHIVKQVMRERGVSLPQASSIVKREGLYIPRYGKGEPTKKSNLTEIFPDVTRDTKREKEIENYRKNR
jgi:hypothetical protein